MDDTSLPYCEVAEYGPDGSLVASSTHHLEDPYDAAVTELARRGVSQTGALPYYDATDNLGCLVWARFPRRLGPSPVAVAWLRETEPPWHVAWGLSLRWGDRSYFVGLGRRTAAPKMIEDPEIDLDLGHVSPAELTGR